MPEAQQTVLEINLSNLEHNFHYLKSKISSGTRFLAVVKAFAYGSDSVTIAKKLEELAVDYLAVAYVNEGVVLREAGIKTPIMVLHPQPVNFIQLLQHCLEPSLYSQRVLNEFIAVAENHNQKDYPVHLKFNTGLNRLGFRENDIDHILNSLRKTSAIKINSVLSHLAASEDAKEKEFTHGQISAFKGICMRLAEGLNYRPIRHMTNTSGILNYPEAHFEMVRSGIGLYGFGNHPSFDKQLKPVASFKTIISQIHEIKDGETVGYNRAYRTGGNRRTATLPVGHADGIGRQYGLGKGKVFVNGKKATIIGNVCMDMLMVDVTEIDCKEGDEVIIFGDVHSADNLAAEVGTISYEVLTAVSQRVKRLIIE